MSVNRNLSQRLRQVLYSMKREYGGTIDIYKLNGSTTDVLTGNRVINKTVFHIQRAVVLPVKVRRLDLKNVAQIAANRAFVEGNTNDYGTRQFIVDRRDCPNLPTLTQDDWIVFEGGKYQIADVESFHHEGWLINAKELVGEIPEQIILRKADHLLVLTSTASAVVE